ncbi:MAG: thrombospondin type 3 repeat-containing protein, partial [Gammaproteobacteria bacterium]|nr:thrombospondin type 3 repeat-containing protein [Gammaproteobacteria bacterium]
APLSVYATDTCTFGTTGLTFSADGASALVSTDGALVSCFVGLYEVHPDNTFVQLIGHGELPGGIPRGVDDHAVTRDGRIILAGDKSHTLWDATAGAGNVSELINLDDLFSDSEVPGWNPAAEVFGSRIDVDPATGIIYYTHGKGPPGSTMTIFSVMPDGSAARIVAEGFYILRDIAFGPGTSGSGRSLYLAVLERADGLPDRGVVYELALANDADNDGLADAIDNCLTAPNPDQRDVDSDAIGSLCDPDFDNDCAVNFADLEQMASVFFTNDELADLDGDGIVNFFDLGLLSDLFFGAPGPSGLPTACD